MTGQFRFAREGRARQARPPRRPVRGRAGRARSSATFASSASCSASGEPEAACGELASLGPEPLEVGSEEFQGHPRFEPGPGQSVLLDQTRLAGVGNIYCRRDPLRGPRPPERPASSLQARRRRREASTARCAGSWLRPSRPAARLSRTPGTATRTATPATSSSPTRSTAGRGSPASPAARRFGRTVVGSRSSACLAQASAEAGRRRPKIFITIGRLTRLRLYAGRAGTAITAGGRGRLGGVIKQ
ncbi:MAG: hypothetical protein MZU84_01875 [Sphingobacterium sp.]|nr:hypothetical protein [Sphingobacterium sp.]